MIRTRLAFLTLAACAMVWLPATANAARSPTEAETAGMVKAVTTYLHTSDKIEVKEVEVSTVDPNWAYGIWEDFQPEFPTHPLMQNVVFQRIIGSDWRVARYPTGVCGISYMEPIPKAAQVDLRLPSCLPSYDLIGRKAFIRDSTGRFESKPRTIKIESLSVTWYLRHIGVWDHWDFTRAARTSARATWEHRTCTPTCEAGNIVREQVEVTITGPRRCGGHWVYGEIAWYTLRRPRQSHGPFNFPCRTNTFS